MILLSAGPLVVAFVVTVLEMTEVVALVFALSADHAAGPRHGAIGATVGIAVVAGAALALGAAFLALPREYLLWASAALLSGFGVFLTRSTLRTYRRERAAAAAGVPVSARPRVITQFLGGFTVGAVEGTEVVVVLLALAAAGQAGTAVVGAIAGGLVLVAATAVVHERVRRIKTRWLKLGATGVVFAFAAFWTGEAAGVRWPYGDLLLVPFFAAALLLVRGTIALWLAGEGRSAAAANG